MCDPTTALNMQIAGGVNSGISSFFQSKVDKSALKGQAAISAVNAELSEMSARGELRKGQRQEQAVRMDTTRMKDQQTVAFATNGIDLGDSTGGSAPIVTKTSTDVMGEIDADTVAANSVRAAWGYKLQGTNYKNDALLKRASAKGINPLTALTTSLLTSASSIATNTSRLAQVGGFERIDM